MNDVSKISIVTLNSLNSKSIIPKESKLAVFYAAYGTVCDEFL